MTDLPGDPRRPDDELVSAVLDGEATPAERARVEADPVLRARLDEFAAVRDQVAAPVAPRSEAARDAAIAAAVAEAGERRRHRANVVHLRRRQEIPRFLAAAAAVLLVLGGFGYLASQIDRTGDDSGDAAAGGESSEDTASTAADEDAFSAEDSAGGDGGAEAATAEGQFGAPSPRSLPPVADEDELRETLRTDAFEASPDSPATEPSTPTTSILPSDAVETRGGSLGCQRALERADTTLTGLLLKATTEYAGVPAVVYVFGQADGGRRVIVVTDATCVPLADFGL